MTSSLSIRPELAWLLVLVASCAVVSLSLSTMLGVFMFIFAIIAWWSWDKSEASLLGLIFLAPLLPLFKVTQTLGTITLVKDIIILTLFAKYVLLPLYNQTLPYRRVVIFWPIALLAIWMALGVLRAESLVLGILRSRDIFLYIVAFFAVLFMPATKEIMQKRIIWALLGAVCVLLLGVYQWFFALDSMVLRFDPVRRIWIPRISSTLAHPTVFGEYLVLLASFFGAGIWLLKQKWRTYSILASLLLLPFVYLTYSRAVWGGYVIALVALSASAMFKGRRVSAFIPSKTQLIAGVVGLLLLLAVAVRFTPVGTFLSTALDPNYASNRERIEFASRLLGSTSSTELFVGRGLGDVVSDIFSDANASADDIVSGDSRSVQLAKDSTLVDNQYLKTFIELGVVGLGIYALLFWQLFKASVRLLSMSPLLGSAGIAFLLAFMFQALFVDIWDVFPTNLFFWIVVAHISLLQVPLQEAD